MAEKLDQNQNLKCVLRIVYYPTDLNYVPLFKRDPQAFDYLYAQCVADFLHNEQILQIHATLEISIRLVSLRVQHLYLMLCSKHLARAAVDPAPEITARESSDSLTGNQQNAETNGNANSSSTTGHSNNQPKPSTNKLFKNSTSFLFAGLRSSKTTPAAKASSAKNAKSAALRLNAEQAFKDANKCVNKVTKEYGLDDFLPRFISDSIKHEELMKMLKYYFKKNQTDLLPEIVERFARQLYDGKERPCDGSPSKRVDCNDNNIGLKAASEANAACKPEERPINLKDVPINEDLVKLSFLALMSEIRSFGNVQFPTRAIALKYRDNDACDFDKKELYKCTHDAPVTAVFRLSTSNQCSLTIRLPF